MGLLARAAQPPKAERCTSVAVRSEWFNGNREHEVGPVTLERGHRKWATSDVRQLAPLSRSERRQWSLEHRDKWLCECEFVWPRPN
jgi:hypothetical protein